MSDQGEPTNQAGHVLRLASKLLDNNLLLGQPLDVQIAAYKMAAEALSVEVLRQTINVSIHNTLNPKR